MSMFRRLHAHGYSYDITLNTDGTLAIRDQHGVLEELQPSDFHRDKDNLREELRDVPLGERPAIREQVTEPVITISNGPYRYVFRLLEDGSIDAFDERNGRYAYLDVDDFAEESREATRPPVSKPRSDVTRRALEVVRRRSPPRSAARTQEEEDEAEYDDEGEGTEESSTEETSEAAEETSEGVEESSKHGQTARSHVKPPTRHRDDESSGVEEEEASEQAVAEEEEESESSSTTASSGGWLSTVGKAIAATGSAGRWMVTPSANDLQRDRARSASSTRRPVPATKDARRRLELGDHGYVVSLQADGTLSIVDQWTGVTVTLNPDDFKPDREGLRATLEGEDLGVVPADEDVPEPTITVASGPRRYVIDLDEDGTILVFNEVSHRIATVRPARFGGQARRRAPTPTSDEEGSDEEESDEAAEEGSDEEESDKYAFPRQPSSSRRGSRAPERGEMSKRGFGMVTPEAGSGSLPEYPWNRPTPKKRTKWLIEAVRGDRRFVVDGTPNAVKFLKLRVHSDELRRRLSEDREAYRERGYRIRRVALRPWLVEHIIGKLVRMRRSTAYYKAAMRELQAR
jgi:hypothetical protein